MTRIAQITTCTWLLAMLQTYIVLSCEGFLPAQVQPDVLIVTDLHGLLAMLQKHEAKQVLVLLLRMKA